MQDLEQTAILDNEVEASLVQASLEETGIPHMIRSFYDAAYDGIFQAQKGWGAVWASPEDRETVLSVVGEIRAAGADSDEETGGEAP